MPDQRTKYSKSPSSRHPITTQLPPIPFKPPSPIDSYVYTFVWAHQRHTHVHILSTSVRRDDDEAPRRYTTNHILLYRISVLTHTGAMETRFNEDDATAQCAHGDGDLSVNPTSSVPVNWWTWFPNVPFERSAPAFVCCTISALHYT